MQREIITSGARRGKDEEKLDRETINLMLGDRLIPTASEPMTSEKKRAETQRKQPALALYLCLHMAVILIFVAFTT